MKVSDCECSSGCESGWTLYLEQSFYSPQKQSGFLGNKKKAFTEEEYEEEEEEEEDLSMVSDASSGPPHEEEEEDEEDEEEEEAILSHFISNNNNNHNHNHKKQHFSSPNNHHDHDDHHHHHDQDDTASSPLLSFSTTTMDFIGVTDNKKNNQGSVESTVLDYSQGFSATHFQRRRRPTFQDPFGFVQSPSISRNQPHENISDLKGSRRWK